jgi:hypothetical protein
VLPGVAMLVLFPSTRLNRLHDELHDLLHGRHRVSRVALDHLRRRTGLFPGCFTGRSSRCTSASACSPW